MPLSEINGIAVTSISKLDGISTVATVDGITYSSGFTPTVLLSYGFDDQTVLSGSTPGAWNPTLTHSGWGNGNVVVNGTTWAPTGTPTNTNLVGKNSAAWRCDSNATGSSNTGPAGALSSAFDGSHDTSSSTKYIYSETSGTLGHELIVCRTPGFRPAQIRTGQNTSLDLRFWLHGYGDSIDTLSVYVDDASTSNEANALLYATYTASHTGTANTGTTTLTAVAGAQHTSVTPTTYTYSNQSNSPWIQSTINLYAIRNETTFHYIYFVMVAKPGISNHRFRGDLGIDQVEIVEV